MLEQVWKNIFGDSFPWEPVPEGIMVEIPKGNNVLFNDFYQKIAEVQAIVPVECVIKSLAGVDSGVTLYLKEIAETKATSTEKPKRENKNKKSEVKEDDEGTVESEV